jgi:hypothetical protein
MSRRKRRRIAGVSGISARRRIARGDRGGHSGIADHPGPAAVTDALEFAVPPALRQPDFDLDVGVFRRLAGHHHTTKGGKRFVICAGRGFGRCGCSTGAPSASFGCDAVVFGCCADARCRRRRECASRDQLCAVDSGAREREARQSLTGRAFHGHGDERAQCDKYRGNHRSRSFHNASVEAILGPLQVVRRLDFSRASVASGRGVRVKVWEPASTGLFRA